VAAPFVPFLTEEIYSNLKQSSVHLTDYPAYDPNFRDQDLEESMQAVLDTVSLGHALRKEHKLKVRQPLKAAFIASGNPHLLDLLRSKKHLIQDELNVKDVIFTEDESTLVHLKPKPNFRSLGKRFGVKMPQVQKLITSLDQKTLAKAQNGETISIEMDGEMHKFTPDEIHVEREVKEGAIAQNFGEITIGLDPTLNDELVLEGIAREIVNKINTMRKDHNFNVTDRIELQIKSTPKVEQAVEQHKEYISQEILATSIKFNDNSGEQLDLNGEPAQVTITVTN
jgi:isoleucyl-tRNA synthetase